MAIIILNRLIGKSFFLEFDNIDGKQIARIKVLIDP